MQEYPCQMARILIQILLVILLSKMTILGQSYDVGISLGKMYYTGDLYTPPFVENLKSSKAGFSVFVRFKQSAHFSIRSNLTYGMLAADDQNSQEAAQLERNLNFRSKIIEWSGLLEYNVWEVDATPASKRWTPFLTLGAAFLHHNPTTLYQGQTLELQPLGTEGQGIEGYSSAYSRNIVTFPMGIGVKYRLSSQVYFQVEFSGRLTTSDYLDDVSGNYVNYHELREGNGELAAILANRTHEYLNQSEPILLASGTPRGNPKVNDFYYSSMLSLYLSLGKNGHNASKMHNCPSF